MFLVVNAQGRYWDGLGWSEQGRLFFSVAAATRSLHEEGEELDEVVILSKDKYDDSPKKNSGRDITTL